MSAPPAEGTRVAWTDVPSQVRGEVERVFGSPVVRAETQPGGFSPGVAARVTCADGSRWFVKAASADLNPDTPRLHRQEARVLAGLDTVIGAAACQQAADQREIVRLDLMTPLLRAPLDA